MMLNRVPAKVHQISSLPGSSKRQSLVPSPVGVRYLPGCGDHWRGLDTGTGAITVQYSTVQYSTVQYSTVQYSTVQYSTVQYSTVQSPCVAAVLSGGWYPPVQDLPSEPRSTLQPRCLSVVAADGAHIR